MLIKDIDQKLDMRLILRVRQDTELFSATMDGKTKLPVFLYSKEDESWMSTYFPKALGNNRFDVMMKRFNAVEKDSAFVVDSRINNKKDLEIINNMMELSSFIVNRSDLYNGFLYIYTQDFTAAS